MYTLSKRKKKEKKKHTHTHKSILGDSIFGKRPEIFLFLGYDMVCFNAMLSSIIDY